MTFHFVDTGTFAAADAATLDQNGKNGN